MDGPIDGRIDGQTGKGIRRTDKPDRRTGTNSGTDRHRPTDGRTGGQAQTLSEIPGTVDVTKNGKG